MPRSRWRAAIFDWIAWLAVVAAIGGTILAYRQSARFLLRMLRFSQLIAGLESSCFLGNVMAEQLLYLPSVGLVAILVILIDTVSSRLPRPSVAAMAIFGVVGFSYTVRTLIRNRDWRDDLTMAAVSVQTSPSSFKVHHLLAVELMRSDPNHSNIGRVIAEADKSLSILAKLPDESNIASPGDIAATGHTL